MGHAIGPCMAVDHVHRYHLSQKKDVVYGLLFLLHDSADLRATNPTRNPPSLGRALVPKKNLSYRFLQIIR